MGTDWSVYSVSSCLVQISFDTEASGGFSKFYFIHVNYKMFQNTRYFKFLLTFGCLGVGEALQSDISGACIVPLHPVLGPPSARLILLGGAWPLRHLLQRAVLLGSWAVGSWHPPRARDQDAQNIVMSQREHIQSKECVDSPNTV